MSGEKTSSRSRAIVAPAGFLVAALAIAGMYATAHLAGLREDTAILSGTVPPGGGSGGASVLGIVYVLLHFSFVIGAPILGIASGLFWLLLRLGCAARATRSPSPHPPTR